MPVRAVLIPPTSTRTPESIDEGCTFGSSDRGIRNNSSIQGSQSPVCKFRSKVRLALVTSVT